MYKINQITKDSLQRHTVIIPELGTRVDLLLAFIPMQYSWVIRELTYDNVKINNMRIVNSYSLLHQFINKLPFGLACISEGDREPTFIDDFAEGYSTLNILTSEEVIYYRDFLNEV